MIPNVALYVVPVALARTREKLDAVLASWAERREQPTMAIRVSGPAALPGKDYDVWVFETTSRSFVTLMSDLEVKVRAAVALRLSGETEFYYGYDPHPCRGVAQVYSRDSALQPKVAERVEDLEPLVAWALGKFAGALEVSPGWLEAWLAAHTSSAEVRVVRWNNDRPKTLGWPRGYALCEDDWRFYDGLTHDSPAMPRTRAGEADRTRGS